MRSISARGFRRLTLGAVALASTIALVGCSGQPQASESSSSGDGVRVIRIANSIDNIDESQQLILDATKKRAEEIMAERPDIRIELDSYDARASVDKQLSDVQTALQKNPDVLLFSPVDNVGSLPAAQMAKDAGIPVIDKRPTEPEPDVYDVAFYANDEPRWASETVKWIQSQLDADPDLVLTTGVIYGKAAQTAQLIRIDEVKKFAAEHPDRVKIVAEAYGDWLSDRAQSITEDWLQAHPEINYIATANDIMATGVVNALQEAGRSDVLVSGYDTNDSALQRIKDGTQHFDVGVPWSGYGEIVDVAVSLVLGEKVESPYYVGAINIATPETVDQYLSSASAE